MRHDKRFSCGPGGGRGRGFGCGPGRRAGADGRGGPYRSRDGMLLGVCRGLADHLDFPVFWMRVLTVLLVLFTGLWPGLVLYFAAGLLMKLEPVVQPSSDTEREFYDAWASSRSGALARVREKFERLERRIRRMEDAVTSKDFSWERRMRRDG